MFKFNISWPQPQSFLKLFYVSLTRFLAMRRVLVGMNDICGVSNVLFYLVFYPPPIKPFAYKLLRVTKSSQY